MTIGDRIGEGLTSTVAERVGRDVARIGDRLGAGLDFRKTTECHRFGEPGRDYDEPLIKLVLAGVIPAFLTARLCDLIARVAWYLKLEASSPRRLEPRSPQTSRAYQWS